MAEKTSHDREQLMDSSGGSNLSLEITSVGKELQKLSFICKSCGACSSPVLDTSTSKQPTQENGESATDEPSKDECNPKQRTRIGRWVKNDKDMEIVDEAN
jgi:hypothetical protein